jgi:hypothetical protein
MSARHAKSLADQVRDAQRAVAKWPAQKRASVRLEGTETYARKDPRRYAAAISRANPATLPEAV